jgi:DNA uptake protein ComE-like DNA-binding protein
MTRRGFALLAVLWTLVAVAAVSGVAIAAARIGSLVTRNRVLLTRAAWAREACAEILLARYAQGQTHGGLDPVDLGRGAWCDAALEDPATMLNVNLADSAAFATVLRLVVRDGNLDSLTAAFLTRRRRGPLADIGELAEVRGFTPALVAQLSRFLTTRGQGVINVNTAPPEVLATLPGMTVEAVALMVARRSASPLMSVDALARWLSPQARTTLLGSYSEFVRAATFGPRELVVFVRGGIRGTPLETRATITMVPVAGRLAVIRRETE